MFEFVMASLGCAVLWWIVYFVRPSIAKESKVLYWMLVLAIALISITVVTLAGFVVEANAQLVSAEREAAFRQLLPEVETDEHSEMLAGKLLFWDDHSRPKTYQNMGHVHDPTYNISGGRDPFGNGNYERPWGETAGTVDTPDVWSFKFLHLPAREDGRHHPVVYYTSHDSSRVVRLGESRRVIRWRFPKNATIGEVLVWRYSDGHDWPFVLLLREIETPGGEHGIAAFQPCATLASYQAAVAGQLGAAAASEHIKQIRWTKPVRMRDRHGRLDETKRVMVLPPVSEDVARRLLSRRWELSIDEDFRPAGPGGLHIVPSNFRHSHVERTRESCTRCHQDTLVNVSAFQSRRDWYGNIRGSDKIFSFHPFDMRCASRNGFNLRVRMDRRLVEAEIIERYNPSKHPQSVYGL
jgi:hypothetical protein